MKNPDDSLIKERLKAIVYSLKGILHLIKTESSFKIQLFIALLVTILGFICELTTTEWMIQCLAIGLVLVAEALNTGVEKLADFVHQDFHVKIGVIKDISAGAAGIAAIISLIIAGLIYTPRISLLF